ncbi:MAG: hypothetical protein MJ252_10965 [archaeon]|nr:hypothetical protein [archaeon]
MKNTKKDKKATKVDNKNAKTDKNKDKTKNKKKEEKKPKKKFPLIPQLDNYKEIIEDKDYNKLFLQDYKNNSIVCNIYGNKSPFYDCEYTGIASYSERKDKGGIDGPDFKKMYKVDPNAYMPEMPKFDGYYQCPRPITFPFADENMKNFNEVRDYFKDNDYYLTDKNKSINNIVPPKLNKKSVTSFMCAPILQQSNENKKYIIKMIDEYIEEEKKNHKYSPDQVYKMESVKALLSFKKVLERNKNGYYNGKILPEPPKEIVENFTVLKKLIREMLLRSDLDKGRQIEVYKEIFRIAGTKNRYVKYFENKKEDKLPVKPNVTTFNTTLYKPTIPFKTFYSSESKETEKTERSFANLTHTTWYGTTNGFSRRKFTEKEEDKLSFSKFKFFIFSIQ